MLCSGHRGPQKHLVLGGGALTAPSGPFFSRAFLPSQGFFFTKALGAPLESWTRHIPHLPHLLDLASGWCMFFPRGVFAFRSLLGEQLGGTTWACNFGQKIDLMSGLLLLGSISVSFRRCFLSLCFCGRYGSGLTGHGPHLCLFVFFLFSLFLSPPFCAPCVLAFLGFSQYVGGLEITRPSEAFSRMRGGIGVCDREVEPSSTLPYPG